jgi:dolichyl-phosphate beta-glucosyltransferase
MTFQTRSTELHPRFASAEPVSQRPVVLHARQVVPLTLVVPCYNEEKRLDGARFIGFLLANPALRMVFVNDGSKDGTLALLRALQSGAPSQIDVLDLPQNAGKAEAVRQGLRHAVARGALLIGYWDADLATPLDALHDFARVAERFAEVAVIFGSRRRMLGHQINRTVKRRVVSGLCAQLARLALRLPIHDTQCGAKLLRNTDALRKAIARPFTAGWLFDVELFARIAEGLPNVKGAFYELPLCEWAEVAGSKISCRAIVNSGFRMLNLIAARRLGLSFPARTAPMIEARVLAPDPAGRLAA